MEDIQVQLLTEQLSRFKDSIDARLKRIEQDLEHHQTLEEEKLINIKAEASQLRELIKDHENRIRNVDDSVISLKTTSGLFQAGQVGLTLIAAAIAAWLGSSAR